MGKRLDYKDMESGDKFAYVSSFVLSMISLVTAFVLVKLTWMVVSKIGSRDRVITSMLICLTLACLASVYFFSYQINQISHPDRTDQSDQKPYKKSGYECGAFIAVWLPSIFLCLAVILNINKWMYFRWRIESLKEQIKI